MQTRAPINWVWAPVVVFGLVRQWVEYGVASAVIFILVFVPFVVLLRRWGRTGALRDAGWKLMTLLFGTCALAEAASIPFAHPSNLGTATVGSRSTTIGAAVTLIVLTLGCVAMIVRVTHRKSQHEDATLIEDLDEWMPHQDGR